MKQFMGIVLLVLVCSCTTRPGNSTPAAGTSAASGSPWAYIEKNGWTLIQLDGTLVSEFNPTIQFDAAKGTMSGFAGCNRYFGTFTATMDTIAFVAAASTMMMGPDAAMSIERAFLERISGKAFAFDIAEQALNFYENGTLVMMFGKTEK